MIKIPIRNIRHFKKKADPVQSINYLTTIIQGEQPKPKTWEQEIVELENYFTGIALYKTNATRAHVGGSMFSNS